MLKTLGVYPYTLILLHSDWTKLHRVLAILAAIGLKSDNSHLKEKSLKLRSSMANKICCPFFAVLGGEQIEGISLDMLSILLNGLIL